jgi:hypothetical protein
MNDFREISDLPPAPRRTPTSVLWVMAAVVLAGSAAVVWSEPADKQLAATHFAQSRANHPLTMRAGSAASTSSRSSMQ